MNLTLEERKGNYFKMINLINTIAAKILGIERTIENSFGESFCVKTVRLLDGCEWRQTFGMPRIICSFGFNDQDEISLHANLREQYPLLN